MIDVPDVPFPRQYNKDVRVKMCPFNATHWIKEPEFRHHLDRCPDKAPIDRAVLAMRAGQWRHRVSGSG